MRDPHAMNQTIDQNIRALIKRSRANNLRTLMQPKPEAPAPEDDQAFSEMVASEPSDSP